MRYPKALTDNQIKQLIKLAHLSNTELGEKFGVSAQIIAGYKSKARSAGVNVPMYSRPKNVIERMKELNK